MATACCSVESQFLRVPRTSWVTPPNVEDVWIDAHNNTKMHAWFFRPTNAIPGEKLPAIAFMHGRSDSMPNYRQIGQSFADATGAALFIFEYRGFGKSSDLECISRASMITDGKAAINTLRARGDIDPLRIAIWGVSLGAYPATANFVDDQSIRALVLWGAPADIRMVINDGHESLTGLKWIVAKLTIGQHREPKHEIAKAGDRPILIVHGQQDSIIKVRNAHELSNAAVKAGIPVQLFIDPVSTHSQVSQEAVDKIASFIQMNLQQIRHQ
jgi:dipeptidyl aminopeptidase/acylaminoacyl peptidase